MYTLLFGELSQADIEAVHNVLDCPRGKREEANFPVFVDRVLQALARVTFDRLYKRKTSINVLYAAEAVVKSLRKRAIRR